MNAIALFNDQRLNVRELNGRPALLVAEICRILNLNRAAVTNLLRRNEDVFAGHKGVVIATTPGGDQEATVLDRGGVIGLLLSRVSTLKNTDGTNVQYRLAEVCQQVSLSYKAALKAAAVVNPKLAGTFAIVRHLGGSPDLYVSEDDLRRILETAPSTQKTRHNRPRKAS